VPGLRADGAQMQQFGELVQRAGGSAAVLSGGARPAVHAGLCLVGAPDAAGAAAAALREALRAAGLRPIEAMEIGAAAGRRGGAVRG
jgi:hypothetical protein